MNTCSDCGYTHTSVSKFHYPSECITRLRAELAKRDAVVAAAKMCRRTDFAYQATDALLNALDALEGGE